MQAAIDQLERTPKILEVLLDGLSPEEGYWKPAPDRWSIAEVMEHLSHVEGHGFRNRIDAMVEEQNPGILEYDQNAFAAAGQYSGREMEESFDHWADQRETNVEFLRGLDAAASERSGNHERKGTLTVGDLLNEWAFHDLGHIRQIAELIRSVRFYPHMGKMRDEYQIHP